MIEAPNSLHPETVAAFGNSDSRAAEMATVLDGEDVDLVPGKLEAKHARTAGGEISIRLCVNRRLVIHPKREALHAALVSVPPNHVVVESKSLFGNGDDSNPTTGFKCVLE